MTQQSVDKVLTLEALPPTLDNRREQGHKVVTTNGCFDILHVGHLRYLQAARQAGDLLVVLLNSDSSVRKLKGPDRPIVPEAERAEMLAGLACVDYVAIFEEETPIETLKILQPDIHAKGAQYDKDSLPEAPILEAMGTSLYFVPMVPGHSTTDLITQIAKTLSQASCNPLTH